MSEELQNEAIEPEIIEQESREEPNGTDLAPVSEAEHEEQPQVDDEAAKQEAINKAINKKHFELKQKEREANELKARLDAIEAKEREAQAAQVANIPPMPDAFDDDYEEKVKKRDEALIAQANFNAQQQAYTQQAQIQQQQAQAAEQARLAEQVTAYNKRASDLGIQKDELNAAANVVGSMGLSDELVKHILADSDGPLIVKHLAENMQEGFDLATMNPYLVGAKLDQIKASASALKPKTTKAPKPADVLQGNGAKPSSKYKHIGGAKFY